MTVTVETLEKLERKITLTLPMTTIQSEVDARLKKLARTVKMDGFRPGKVPMNVVHLNNLREGELLFFKKDDTALMTANGVPAFHVNVGTRGSQVAVQIDHEHVHGKL